MEALAVVIIGSFAILGAVVVQMINNAPQIPQQVVTADGRVIFDHDHIQQGQGVWQSLGGQEIGSIWGHGAYIAPDWTADYLHREALFVLDSWAQSTGARDYQSLPEEQQAVLRARLEREFRTNTYDPVSGRVTISPARAEAFEALTAYYADVSGNGRDDYAIQRGALTDKAKARQMVSFFWWTGLGSFNQPTGADSNIHAELAARAPDREPTDG